MTRSLSALTILCSAFLFQASAAVTLLPPVELNNKVDQVRDAVAANHDPEALRIQIDHIFEQAQNTHHLPVTGLGYNPNRADVAAKGGQPTVASIMDRYRSLITQGPPSPLLDSKKDGLQARAFLRMEELSQGARIMPDGEGGRKKELPDEALAAYAAPSFNTADTAAGFVLLQGYFFNLARYLGEFALETFAHEGEHRADHVDGNLDPVKKEQQELRAMTRSYDFLTRYIPDMRWKFSKLCQQLMGTPQTPREVKTVLAHIGKIMDHGDRGRLEDYVEQLYHEH